MSNPPSHTVRIAVGSVLLATSACLLFQTPATAADRVLPMSFDAPYAHDAVPVAFHFDADRRLLFAAGSSGTRSGFVHAIAPVGSGSTWTWNIRFDDPGELGRLTPCPAGGFVAGGYRDLRARRLWTGAGTSGWIARIDSAGRTIWRSEVGDGPFTSPNFPALGNIIVDDECNVLVGAAFESPGSDGLIALRAADGSIAWTRPSVDDSFEGTFAVGPRWVRFSEALDGVTVEVIEPVSGAGAWERQFTFPGQQSGSYPNVHDIAELTSATWAVVSGWTTATGRAVEVRSLDAGDGSTQATRVYDATALDTRAVKAGPSVVVLNGRQLERLGTGLQVIWSRQMPFEVGAIAGLPDGGALVCLVESSDTEYVVRLSAETGATLWPLPLQRRCRSDRIVVSADGAEAAMGPPYPLSGLAFPPVRFDVATGNVAPGQSDLRARLGHVGTGRPIVVDMHTVLDVGVTAYREGSELVVRSIARASGNVNWTQRLAFGQDGLQRNDGSATAAVLADGSLLVAGHTRPQVPSLIVVDGPAATSAVIARLRASDGVVLERTAGDESNAVVFIEVAPSGAVFATRFLVYRDPVLGMRELQAIDRMEGIGTLWRRNGTPRAAFASPSPFLRIAATSTGVVAYDPRDAAAPFQSFDAADGSVRWTAMRTVVGPLNALVSNGSDRLFVVYPTRANRPDTDVTVERLDPANGSALWSRTFDIVPGSTDELAGSVAILPSGFALAWNTVVNFNVPGTSRTAMARITDAGVVEWARVLDLGRADWLLEPRGLTAAPNGDLVLLTANAPDRSRPFSVETAALARVAPDGQVVGVRTFASATESNAVSGWRTSRLYGYSGDDAVVGLLQSAGPTTYATALIPATGFAAGAPALSMVLTPIPSTVRQVRVAVHAEVPVVPMGTTGTITIAMPPGLIAGPATCSTVGALSCGTVRGGTTVVVPLTIDAAGSIDVSFVAAMPAGPLLSGPIVGMIDVDHGFETDQIRDRVAMATVDLLALPEAVFRDGFE